MSELQAVPASSVSRLTQPDEPLIGTNPVLDAVEDGHFQRDGRAKEPKVVCRCCGTEWPCGRVLDARRAASARSRRSPR